MTPLGDLARAGIEVTRLPWDGLSLGDQRFTVMGHGEVSRYGLYRLAEQHGIREIETVL